MWSSIPHPLNVKWRWRLSSPCVIHLQATFNTAVLLIAVNDIYNLHVWWCRAVSRWRVGWMRVEILGSWIHECSELCTQCDACVLTGWPVRVISSIDRDITSHFGSSMGYISSIIRQLPVQQKWLSIVFNCSPCTRCFHASRCPHDWMIGRQAETESFLLLEGIRRWISARKRCR